MAICAKQERLVSNQNSTHGETLYGRITAQLPVLPTGGEPEKLPRRLLFTLKV
jgi:hypothetical protein